MKSDIKFRVSLTNDKEMSSIIIVFNAAFQSNPGIYKSFKRYKKKWGRNLRYIFHVWKISKEFIHVLEEFDKPNSGPETKVTDSKIHQFDESEGIGVSDGNIDVVNPCWKFVNDSRSKKNREMHNFDGI